MTKILNIIIAVLVITAVVLGYFVYQSLNNETPATINEQPTTPATNTTNVTGDSGANNDELSSDERAALTPPGPNATDAEFQAHFELVNRIGVDGSELVIGQNCSMTPVVLKTKVGDTLTARNTDNVPHTIVFNQEVRVTVPANGSSIEVPAAYSSQGAGIYGYGCDEGAGAVGMIFVGE